MARTTQMFRKSSNIMSVRLRWGAPLSLENGLMLEEFRSIAADLRGLDQLAQLRGKALPSGTIDRKILSGKSPDSLISRTSVPSRTARFVTCAPGMTLPVFPVLLMIASTRAVHRRKLRRVPTAGAMTEEYASTSATSLS